MGKIDEKLIETLFVFSDLIGIDPPRTCDIANWWREGLEQMDDYWLLDLYEHGFLSKRNQPTLKKMYDMLVQQIEKRQLINTLA